MEIKIFCTKDWADYELLDTGAGEKLERFGKYNFVRPEEDALWPKALEMKEMWEKADGKFWSSKTGAKAGWKMHFQIEPRWEMSYKDIKFFASPTPFRHLGFFPEQASHWDFIEEKISSQKNNSSTFLQPSAGTFRHQNDSSASQIKFLNLFGYTGVASLFALRAGAEVTHVDASKKVLDWAKDNQKLSGMSELPMRVIKDDVGKFLAREEKRGNKYDCLVLDPPKYGRGPKGEVWKIEEMLPSLLLQVRKVLSDKPLFVILTSYATDSSPLALKYALEDAMKGLGGKVEAGELCLSEKSNNRLISLANTAIWSV